MCAKTIRVPKVVRGGAAVPLGNNFYYMVGKKHKDGGIDIGKDLEVESGEIVQTQPDAVKVFSSVPFLNGKSPAQKVLGGENPNKVFNQQESYKDRNNINDDGTKKKKIGGKIKPRLDVWNIRRKAMGGLSRSKDYGSKSKPYPSVKSGDFAGGHRSYPIPTKSDAVDALRLAGLHGRSDVKAKVYDKYPELKKKAKTGGIYSLTSNGSTRLMFVPSTGKDVQINNGRREKAEYGTNYANNMKYYGDNLAPLVNRLSGLTQLAPMPTSPTTITPPTTLKQNAVAQQANNSSGFSLNGIFDNNTVNDFIGTGSNIVGAILARNWGNKALKSISDLPTPIAQRATKLKTRININPQLDKMRESLASYERNVDANTASSQVALARKQRARLSNVMSTNQLYSDKENRETELINKDRLNRQNVSNANVQAHNQWAEKNALLRNSITERLSGNNINLLNTINMSIQDLLNRGEKRENERQTRLAMAAATPNVNPRILKDLGIKGITDADIKRWESAYGK